MKTYSRSLASLAIGEFHAHITQLTCSHCQKTYDNEELQTVVPPNTKFAFDVMVSIGDALFLRSRNGNEIQRELGEKNIGISLREIDYLSRRFIVYLALAHEQSQGQLKQFMESRGGCVLHLDGTCEGDSPHYDFCQRLQEAYPDLQRLKQKMADTASLLPLRPLSKILADQALASTVLSAG